MKNRNTESHIWNIQFFFLDRITWEWDCITHNVESNNSRSAIMEGEDRLSMVGIYHYDMVDVEAT